MTRRRRTTTKRRCWTKPELARLAAAIGDADGITVERAEQLALEFGHPPASIRRYAQRLMDKRAGLRTESEDRLRLVDYMRGRGWVPVPQAMQDLGIKSKRMSKLISQTRYFRHVSRIVRECHERRGEIRLHEHLDTPTEGPR